MDLEAALREFETVEANLAKLEATWGRMRAIIPGGLVFAGSSPEAREYRQLSRAFQQLLGGLPPVDGWQITAQPQDLDAIFQNRLDARELGEVHVELEVERGIEAPGDEIDEYRSRLMRARGRLVRARLDELTTAIDEILARLAEPIVSRDDHISVRCPDWERMEQLIAEVDRLLGASTRSKAWPNLRRHLSFAKGCDLWDIRESDWPAVKLDIARLAFDDSEPMPVHVADLGVLAASRPSGTVSTALNWSSIDDEGFERLVFAIISDAPGYQNAAWLMRTNAPDRGRDLSVWRIRTDSLAGETRDRVIIQCKNWRSRSVADTDVANAVTKMTHWEPPPVDVLVIATSGRFTADAVAWIERHNHAGKRPKIEAWPESHLERHLAQRPHLVVSFHLR